MYKNYNVNLEFLTKFKEFMLILEILVTLSAVVAFNILYEMKKDKH